MTTEKQVAAIQARHDRNQLSHGEAHLDRGVLLDIVRDLTTERDRLRAACRVIERGGWGIAEMKRIARRALAWEAT